MLQLNDGKNIAFLFYARVRVVFLRAALAVVCFGLSNSTALTKNAHAAAKIPPRAVENSMEPIRFETIKPFKTVRVIRTNITNNAFEELLLAEKTVSVKRSTGVNKSLPQETDAFAALEQKIRALGMLEVKSVKPLDGVKVEIAVKTADGEKRFEIDPSGSLQPIYAELMALRNKVLADGK